MIKFNWFITRVREQGMWTFTIVPHGLHTVGTPIFYTNDDDSTFILGNVDLRGLLERGLSDTSWKVILPTQAHLEDFRQLVLETESVSYIISQEPAPDFITAENHDLVIHLGRNDRSWVIAIIEAEFPAAGQEDQAVNQEKLLPDTPTAISNVWVACIRHVPFYGLVLHLSNLTPDIMLNQDLYKEIESYADAKGGLLVINHTEVNNRMMRHVIRKAAADGLLVVEASNQADLDGFVKSVVPLLNDDSVYEKCFTSLGSRQSIEISLTQDTNKLVASNNRYFLSRIVEGLDK